MHSQRSSIFADKNRKLVVDIRRSFKKKMELNIIGGDEGMFVGIEKFAFFF